MRTLWFFLVLSAYGFSFTADFVCAEMEPFVKAEVDQAFITIGDKVNFRLTVVHDQDERVVRLDATGALQDFEIKKITDFSFKEEGRVHEGRNYLITSYELGEYVIQPITITLETKEKEAKELQTNQLYVTVHSIAAEKEPDGDIRGVKNVYELTRRLWLWLAVLAAGLAGIGLFAWRFLSKKQTAISSTSESLLSPDEEAYRALFQLKHSDLLRKNKYKLYFLQMSYILRRYFERCYEISALESTTFELIRDLKEKLSAEDRKLVQDILSLCDFVKFAKYTPSVPEVLQQNKQAVLIIDRTKEQAQESSETVAKD